MDCLVHETSVTRYGISKSAYPLRRFRKPRYVARDSGRKEGTFQRGCREDRGVVEGAPLDAMGVEDALQWAPRQRARSV